MPIALALGLGVTFGKTVAAGGSAAVGVDVTGLGLTVSNGGVTATAGSGSGALQATSLQTSVTYSGATYTFSSDSSSLVPVTCEVGVYEDGQPFVVKNANYVWRVSPDSAVSALSSSIANGLMINPWLEGPDLPNHLTSASQGFDQLLDTTLLGSSSNASPWVPALNKDPAIAGAISMLTAQSLVKSIRKAGLTLPMSSAQFPVFSNWSVLHVVDVVPPLGAFAPAASNPDKTSRYTTAMRQKNVLGAGLAYSTGMPTLAACEAGDHYFPRSFWPFFGQGTGEYMQPMITDVPVSTNQYSAYYAQYWCDWFAAMLCEGGTAVSDALLNRALAFGVVLIGLIDRAGGRWGKSGAGQHHGYQQFAMLAGFMFEAAVPGTIAKALEVYGNAVHQSFWLPATGFVGNTTQFIANNGITTNVIQPELIGMPFFAHDAIFDSSSHAPIYKDTYDGENIDCDYHTTGCRAAFAELFNIMMLRNGPSGKDGAQVLARTTSTWGTTNEYAACIAYEDRMRSISEVYGNPIRFARSNAFYDDRRASCSAPRWVGRPDVFIPEMSYRNTYVFPISGGFGWNLSTAGNFTETVVEWQVQYGLSDAQWFDVTVQGVSGTQTGLPLLPIYVRHRRRSASGWSIWSVCYPRNDPIAADGVLRPDHFPRNVVTPTGSPSNAAPVFTQAPKLAKAEYPLWEGPSWIDCSGATLTEAEVIRGIIVGSGMVTGHPAPTITQQKVRAGALVNGRSSTMTLVDEVQDATKVIIGRAIATNSVGEAYSNSASVTWYGLVPYANQLVRFNGTSDRFRRTTDLAVADNKKAIFFASLKHNAAVGANEYYMAANGIANRFRRSSDGRLSTLWGAAALGAVSSTGAPVAGERVNVLAVLDADATSRMVQWTETNRWYTVFEDTTSGGVVFDFTLGSFSIGASDQASAANFLSADVARIALWLGVAPDLRDINVRSKFSSNLSGDIVDPSVSNTAYGTPVVDFRGPASEWNNLASNNKGSGGAFGVGGTVVDVTGDITKPLLTDPAGVQTGETTATLSVDITETNGVLYALAFTSATPASDAAVLAGMSQAITTSGTKSFSYTGLTNGTRYYPNFVQVDAAGNHSNVTQGMAFTTLDLTAPLLTSPGGVALTSTTATLSVTTNEPGPLYASLTTSGTPPSAASIVGGGGVYAGNQMVVVAGAKTFNATGLTAGTTYWPYFVQDDLVTPTPNRSLVSAGASFTTPSPTVVLTYIDHKESGTSLTTHTLTGFGVVSGDAGKLAVAVIGHRSGAVGLAPTSVNICGVAATLVVGTTTDTTIDGSASIWKAVLGGSPGTTITSSTSPSSTSACGATLFLLSNVNSAQTDSIEIKGTTAATSHNTGATIDTITGGVMICGCMENTAGTGVAFTGSSGGAITERSRNSLAGGTCTVSSRSDGVAHTGETITATGVSVQRHLVVATFGA